MPRGTVETSASASTFDFTKEYADAPLANGSETLLYIPEQANPAIRVEVTIRFGEGQHLLKANLPSVIRRNEIYTLAIQGKGAEAQLVIEADGWGTGASTESDPSIQGLVDVENSLFSDGVRVNETRDTVFVPYHGSDFMLALLAEANATVTVDGSVEGVEVNRNLGKGRSTLQKIAELSVRSSLRMPGRDTERIHLDIQDPSSTNLGRVVLVIEANPIQIEGAIHFDKEATCDFKEYVEGELGIIRLPANKVLRVELIPTNRPGCKPRKRNRLPARGCRARAIGLSVAGNPTTPEPMDGLRRDGLSSRTKMGPTRRPIPSRRINWGLPVVKIGETWWCKYNLRGNVKSFEDQITIPNDPAPHHDLLSYLTTVSEDELLNLLGDQYQGGNKQGLPLRHDGTAFYHEGVAASAQNFGTLPPAEMAPPGYQIPGYDDYLAFSKNGNFNLGGVGSRSYQNSKGTDHTDYDCRARRQFSGP